MQEIILDWADLKSEFLSKHFLINHKKIEKGYQIYVQDRNILWTSKVVTEADVIDFEENYKSESNKCMYADDGKEISRTESRPLDTTTYFTMAGDSANNIGDGNKLFWDFSNDDNIVEGAPEGYKKKRVEFRFIDIIYIKEGALYFHKALKGSYVNVCVVCPAGNYYLKNDGTPALATVDTIIARYTNNHYFQGDCPMGDELNTESCSGVIPTTMKFWIEVYVPVADVESNGYISMELYRRRTVVL